MDEDFDDVLVSTLPLVMNGDKYRPLAHARTRSLSIYGFMAVVLVDDFDDDVVDDEGLGRT